VIDLLIANKYSCVLTVLLPFSNYFYIFKTIASVYVPVVEHLGCHSREVSRFCVRYALKPKKQLSIGHIQQIVFSVR